MDTFIKIIAVIFLSVAPAFCLGQSIRIEFANSNPNNKIHSETISYQKYDDNRNVIESGSFGIVSNFKNIVNDSLEILILDNSNNYKYPVTRQFKKYDINNLLIQEESWLYNNNLKTLLVNRIIYKYDALKRREKENEYAFPNKLIRTKTYKYQDEFIATVDTTFVSTIDSNPQVLSISRDTTFLDSLNRPLEIFHYYNDIFLYKEAFVYEKNGYDKTELRYTESLDNLWSTTWYKYDDKKNIISVIVKSKENKIEKTQYSYDKNGRIIKYARYVDNLLAYDIKYKYLKL